MRNLFLILNLCLAIIAHKSQATVFNPLMFIGEVVKGAINGAPLSADANGKLASGISNSETSSTTASTCTTGGISITGISVTPVAGTYLAIYSSDFNSANGGTVVTIQYQIAGASVTISQRKFMPFSGGTLTAGNQRVVSGLNSILTVTGSQAITVNCSTSASTVTTANSQLDIVRLQ